LGCIANICRGNEEQIQSITRKGGVYILKQALNNVQEKCRVEAILALGNIAGDNFILRDLILKEGVLPLILANMEKSTSFSILNSSTWCLANICRSEPKLSMEYFTQIIKPLAEVIKNNDDQKLLLNSTWTLYYLSETKKEKIDLIIKSGVIPRLIGLLKHELKRVSIPCLRVLGTISAGADEQTQVIINAGIIPVLKELILSDNQSLKKESFWVLSNIAGGTEAQLEVLIANDVITLAIKAINKYTYEIKLEALWLLLNATQTMPARYVDYMLTTEIIEALMQFLHSSEAKALLLTLQAIENMLRKAKEVYGDRNNIKKKIEESGCVHIIEGLQYHANEDVYELANEIIEEYLVVENIEDVLGSITMASITNGTEGTISMFNF